MVYMKCRIAQRCFHIVFIPSVMAAKLFCIRFFLFLLDRTYLKIGEKLLIFLIFVITSLLKQLDHYQGHYALSHVNGCIVTTVGLKLFGAALVWKI